MCLQGVDVGAGYSAGSTLTGASVSIGRPSSTQRGRPPFIILDLLWPKLRNIKRARGEENTPCVS